MKNRVLGTILLVVWFMGLSVSPAHAKARNYTVIELGTLSGNESYPFAINERGQVVGYGTLDTPVGEDEQPLQHAFLWEDGVMTDLGTLGGDYSIALEINDRGQVVGESSTASGEVH